MTEALEMKRRLGQYAVIAENGQPRRITPDEIGVLLEQRVPADFKADAD